MEREIFVNELISNYQKKRVVAVIPARKGSKRLPGKNRKLLCGKELIRWSIELALKCNFIDEVIVSTDDEYILNMCKGYYKYNSRLILIDRPLRLSEDSSRIEDVILHALRGYASDTDVILLQPTSPLRNLFDISHAYQIFNERVSCTLVSVFREDFLYFKLNGCIYIFTLGALRLTNKVVGGEFMCIYIMPRERSVDIDILKDFELAEKLMKERLEKSEL